MRGRRPKPTVLHVINGTKRPWHGGPDEPVPEGELTAPPDGVSDEQRAEWVYAIEHAPPGLLRELDRNLFLQWVVASVDLTEAEREIREQGKVIERGGNQRITIHPDGSQTKTVSSAIKVKSPWIAIRRDAFDRLMKATCELGFSPTSRSRIGTQARKKAQNPFAAHAARRA